MFMYNKPQFAYSIFVGPILKVVFKFQTKNP